MSDGARLTRYRGMSDGARLAGFALTLLVALGAGFGVGRAVGPLEVDGPRSGTVPPGSSVPGPDGHGSPGGGHGAEGFWTGDDDGGGIG